MKLKEGQCGLCTHFGNGSPNHKDLSEIRKKKEVEADYKEKCDLPRFSTLNLVVNANCSCDGYEAVKE